jgi:ketosteroid isomerase-like protein
MLRWLLLFIVGLLSCSKPDRLTANGFDELVRSLATAWSTQNTNTAVACFTDDAEYMQPPDEQFFVGRAQLTAYFGAIQPGTSMVIHHVWFDEHAQQGAFEFTFGRPGSKKASTGVVVVQIKNNRIARWREYFVSGPFDFNQFLETKNKEWKWHIGNYP